jgi:hypothetical protein
MVFDSDEDPKPYFEALLIIYHTYSQSYENQVFDILLGRIVENLYYCSLGLSCRDRACYFMHLCHTTNSMRT